MADEIKINADAWNNLSEEDRSQINTIIAESGLAGTVTPDPDAPDPAQAGGALKFPGGGAFCKVLCDIAATAAKLACARLPAPAQPICIAAADAGAELCKGRCPK